MMVLAHNEADHIVACLDSLYAAEPGTPLTVFVIANGCTDETERLVAEYAKRHPGVHLVSIAMGDKCNAWNVFIHEVIPNSAPDREAYFFMDGDARITPRAMTELARALKENPDAFAAAALPVTGRSMKHDRRKMLDGRELVANLYALSGPFVRHLQDKGVRLPLGLEGDDGLLGALVKWNLNPGREWDDRRIVPCLSAGFAFESMSWVRPRDWRVYWRRRIRYGRRHFEFELLGPRLKQEGIQAMPKDIRELYKFSGDCRLRWRGIQTIFDWLALKQLRTWVTHDEARARLA
ncbi:MAG: glycosyltransferase [Candidatus Rokuibacteriota bacterium]